MIYIEGEGTTYPLLVMFAGLSSGRLPCHALMTVLANPSVPSVTSSNSDHPCATLPASLSKVSTLCSRECRLPLTVHGPTAVTSSPPQWKYWSGNSAISSLYNLDMTPNVLPCGSSYLRKGHIEKCRFLNLQQCMYGDSVFSSVCMKQSDAVDQFFFLLTDKNLHV